jgi:hypothetical protein
MIEAAFLLFGVAFSVLVYIRSIGPAPLPPVRKALVTVVTFFGIIGMVTIIGALIAPRIRSLF